MDEEELDDDELLDEDDPENELLLPELLLLLPLEEDDEELDEILSFSTFPFVAAVLEGFATTGVLSALSRSSSSFSRFCAAESFFTPFAVCFFNCAAFDASGEGSSVE